MSQLLFDPVSRSENVPISLAIGPGIASHGGEFCYNRPRAGKTPLAGVGQSCRMTVFGQAGRLLGRRKLGRRR
jgi:hypothetical protein